MLLLTYLLTYLQCIVWTLYFCWTTLRLLCLGGARRRGYKTATPRTKNFPFAAGLIGLHVDRVVFGGEVDLGSVVRPRAKLHRTALVVEWKPLNVDGAGGDEETERDPGHLAATVDHRVRRKRAVNVLVSTAHTHTHTHTRGGYGRDVPGSSAPSDVNYSL